MKRHSLKKYEKTVKKDIFNQILYNWNSYVMFFILEKIKRTFLGLEDSSPILVIKKTRMEI